MNEFIELRGRTTGAPIAVRRSAVVSIERLIGATPDADYTLVTFALTQTAHGAVHVRDLVADILAQLSTGRL